MLSFMVLLVLILILAQIQYSTNTTARVARNEETLVQMDSAIESSLLQVFEDLETDAASDTGSSGAPDLGGGDSGGSEGEAGAGAEQSGPTDSKEDEWARPQRTDFDDVQLRILIQDEDSKFNLLSVLTRDEEEADKAFDRLTRVIEWSRKGTRAEIDAGTARRMAEAMREFMRRRSSQVLPRPELLSDDEEERDVGLPLSLREFVALDPELFPEALFQDYLDPETDEVVHSLGSFLTVWSSVGTAEEARDLAREESGETAAQDSPGEDDDEGEGEDRDGDGLPDPEQDGDQGGSDGQDGQGSGDSGGQAGGGQGGQGDEAPPGWAINVNTAPGAVLHALMDSRDLPYRFWDDVVLYRNEKDESVEENEDPPLDEYGKPILVRQYFRSTGDLSKVDGWEAIEPIVQGELQGLLKTQSQVFSIFVTARKPTGEERIDPGARREDIEREEADWQGLVRTVRAVVWRRTLGEGEVEIVPIVRWEVLDYVPFEVLDFPEDRDKR
jgi:hypothetical protein